MGDALDKFLSRENLPGICKATGWTITRDGDNPEIVRLVVSARDGERYIVRCECTGYPEETPSVIFISSDGSKDDATAWPSGDAEFGRIVKPPPNCFLCTSLTREGLAHHSEWRATPKAWNGKTHTLLDIFNLVNRLLNDNHYTGRKRI